MDLVNGGSRQPEFIGGIRAIVIDWLEGLELLLAGAVYQFDIAQQGHHSTVIGEIYQRQSVPVTQLHEAGIDTTGFTGPAVDRLVIKSGNRELRGSDFVTVLQPHIAHQPQRRA